MASRSDFEKLLSSDMSKYVGSGSTIPVTSSGGDLFTPSERQKDESKRTARKIGEKLRRERLNGHLTQLSEQIPWIADSERRLDKVSILRLTVNYMKLHHGLKKRKVSGVWHPSAEDKQMIQGYLQEAADGFMIVVSKSGTVIFVSQTIHKYLGHDQVDVIGNSIYNIVHPDDHDILEMQFTCKQGQESHVVNQHEDSKSHSKHPQINSAYNEHRSFYIHMQNLPNGENENHYELVHVLGHMRFDSGHKHTQQKKHSGLDDTWLVALCRIEEKQPILEISQFYVNKNEFISQHAMDGKVLFNDQRVAVITGFMASSRVGASVYSLINPEDMDAVAVSHMKIMTDGEIPSTIFRIFTVTGAQVYIQSRSVIIKDAVTKAQKYIVSVNVCLGQKEGNSLLEEQKKRVKALIAATNSLSLNEMTNKGDNTQKVDKNSNSEESRSVAFNTCSSKPCKSVSCVSKGDIKNARFSSQTNGVSRGTKRQFNEEESELESAGCHGNSESRESQENGQSHTTKENSKASSLLKSLLLSDDTDRDMEILKEKSMITEMAGNSKSFPVSSRIDDSSGEKSNNEITISNGNSSSLLVQSGVSHKQNKSSCINGNSPSPTGNLTPFISNDTSSPTEDFRNSPLRAFQTPLHLPSDTLDIGFPNCQKDSLGKNSTCVSQILTTHDNIDLFSQTDKQHSPFQNSHSSYNQTSQTSKPNSPWNLMDILQGHVNKSSLCEAECTKDRSSCCGTSSLIDSSDLPFYETDYNATNTQSSDLENGGTLNERISDLNSCHWRDQHVNQNITVSLRDSDNPPLNNTQLQTRERNGEIASPSAIQTNGLSSKVEENCSSTDTNSYLSKQTDLSDKESKVKMLLARQLHMKHDQIGNNLKNQTDQLDCMKIQMKMLQDLNNTSLPVTSFMEQLSELQDKVSKQKKMLIDLKSEAVLPDMTLKNHDQVDV